MKTIKWEAFSAKMKSAKFADYVIVGGGVCGVCIHEELNELLDNEEVPGTSNQNIAFVTGRGGQIKQIVNTKQIGQLLSFDVENKMVDSIEGSKRTEYFQSDVVHWDQSEKILILGDGTKIAYSKLAIATGADAKKSLLHPCIVRLRDTQTIKDLQAKLKNARRVLVIGNGGIASELAFELKEVEVIWAIRHNSILATYFDAAAAKFFEKKLATGRVENNQKEETKRSKLICTKDEKNNEKNRASGSALGPYWIAELAQQYSNKGIDRKIFVINDVELDSIFEQFPTNSEEILLPQNFLPNSTEWMIWAKLNNGKIIGCDLIIEATGVVPNSQIWKRNCPNLELAEDGGIIVDEQLKTNIPDVFAAGDVCSPNWSKSSLHWKQIRLWTQARQMGIYCARAMLIKELLLDIAFDIFTHVTTFFGYKVTLLGDFAGEKLEKPFEVNYRITDGVEYVKVLTKDHRIHGAVLIGETELEETMENLILNQTNISEIEEDILNPNVDIEDYFD